MLSGEPIASVLSAEMSAVVPLAAPRLVVAAILGGIIGLDRELKHRPAGIRTNMFMCIGSCLFTILSSALSVDGDHTRIAAQVVTGIGFIGAGSILHERKDLIIGLTTAATIFVVAAVGMAVGGGLYLTAVITTAIVFLSLFLLGRFERAWNLKSMICAYEVTGSSGDDVSVEVNRVLEPMHALMRNPQVAPTPTHVRLQFELEGTRNRQQQYEASLRQSPLLQNVTSLGPIEPE